MISGRSTDLLEEPIQTLIASSYIDKSSVVQQCVVLVVDHTVEWVVFLSMQSKLHYRQWIQQPMQMTGE